MGVGVCKGGGGHLGGEVYKRVSRAGKHSHGPGGDEHIDFGHKEGQIGCPGRPHGKCEFGVLQVEAGAADDVIVLQEGGMVLPRDGRCGDGVPS